METIASFKINHLKMNRGIFVSRVDKLSENIYATTFDIRVVAPNKDMPITPESSHTIEHLVATYLRNSKQKNNIIYFGPMGCLTGFYLVMWDYKPLASEDVCSLILGAFKYVATFMGEIPGASPVECGNYTFHDLAEAKKVAKKYIYYMNFNKDNIEKIFYYPESE